MGNEIGKAKYAKMNQGGNVETVVKEEENGNDKPDDDMLRKQPSFASEKQQGYHSLDICPGSHATSKAISETSGNEVVSK